MANSDFPWFRFYARDWLCDSEVIAMPLAAQGAYIRLLCHQWENGSIPYREDAIARILGVSVDELADELWVYVEPKFTGAHQLRNARLEEIRAEVTGEKLRKSVAGSIGGKASAQARRKKGVRTIVQRLGKHPDADADADAEKKKMKKKRMSTRVDSRPVPGKGDDFPIISWNMLAERHYLQPIEKLTTARKKALASALHEFPDFWERLEVELGKRSNWAKERRFPNFDQATRASTLVKILEGNYRLDFDSKPKTLRQSNILPTDGPATITVDGEEHVIPDPDESF